MQLCMKQLKSMPLFILTPFKAEAVYKLKILMK